MTAEKKKAQKVCHDFQIDPPRATITEKSVFIIAKVRFTKSEHGCWVATKTHIDVKSGLDHITIPIMVCIFFSRFLAYS